MPRDLHAQLTPLTKRSASPPYEAQNPLTLANDQPPTMKELRPYCLLLNQADLDDCDWLEHAAFDPNEAATREKLDYRLSTCGELCSGIFASAYLTHPDPIGSVIRSRKFPSVDSAHSDRKRVLLGHIIATKSKSDRVTDDSMAFPADWRTKYQLNPSTGHTEEGDTICLHSLCVHPSFHKRGLGTVLLKGWTQRIRDAGLGKRIALICRDYLVGFYEKAGFKKLGPSACQYGGGNWIDMILEFPDPSHDVGL